MSIEIPRRFIGLAGGKGSGKSTTAKELQTLLIAEGIDCEIIPFATLMKTLMKLCYGCTDADVNTQNGKRRRMRCGLTVRQAMGKLGKTLRAIDSDAFIRPWKIKVAQSPSPVIIADDVRLENEALCCLSRGMVFQLLRFQNLRTSDIYERPLSAAFVSRTIDNRQITAAQAAEIIFTHFMSSTNNPYGKKTS